jgi:hypothetical protein
LGSRDRYFAFCARLVSFGQCKPCCKVVRDRGLGISGDRGVCFGSSAWKVFQINEIACAREMVGNLSGCSAASDRRLRTGSSLMRFCSQQTWCHAHRYRAGAEILVGVAGLGMSHSRGGESQD